MKTWLIALSMAVAGATLTSLPTDADARRLGGGKSAGMQRQSPPPQTPAQPGQPAQAQNGAAAAAPTAAAAQAPKRSWMGPIAGLAAGLGLAALLSHFGLGAGFANFLTLLLVAAVGFFVLRWLLRRFAGAGSAARPAAMQFAGATAAGPQQGFSTAGASPAAEPRAQPSAAPLAVQSDFDRGGFERIAKLLFIRLQAANDARAVDDLRRFTTPELFASLKLDLNERGDTKQQTDVVQLEAELIEHAQEQGQWVASVRFHGLIREHDGANAEPFDEVWHFVQPLDRGVDWAIAGITTRV